MKDLLALTDVQLAAMENAINERGRFMLTPEGKKESQLWTLRMIDYLVSSGYKPPDASKDRMAVVYADQLKEAIVTYGYDELQRVVREWVRNDARQYKSFPTSGDILDAVKKMLGNPAAEIARRQHEQEVERIVARERKELQEKFEKGTVSKEHIAELERRYRHE